MRKSHILLMAMLTAVTVGLTACSHVSEDWKAAQAADTTEAYQDFLRQHPDSEFGVTAHERVKQLAEDRDWQAASKTDTLDAYQQFVATHADGKWAQEARVRIENFQLSGNGQAPAAAGAEGAANTAAPAAGAVTTAVAPAAETAPAKPEAAAPANPTVKPTPAVKATHAAKAKPAASPKLAAAAKSAAGKSGHRHLAQLGAYGSKASAESAWRKLSGKFPTQLKSLRPHYVVSKLHGKPVVRLQVGVTSAKQSRELCSALKKQSQPCVPLG